MMYDELSEHEEDVSVASIVERISFDDCETGNVRFAENCPQDGINRYPVDIAMDMYAPMSAEEERIIWETKPRSVAKKLLILHNMQFAAQMARRYSVRGADFEDLRQIALLGLVKAAEGYDPEKAPTKDDGTRQPFISYAGKVIRTLLSRESNPDTTIAATKTNLRTFLLPSVDDGGEARIMDSLFRDAAKSKWRTDSDGEEFINGMMSGLQQLMKSDCTDTFTQEAQNCILRWVKSLVNGKSVVDIAAEEKCCKQNIAKMLSRFKAFLIRKALANSADLGDVDSLLQKSEYVKTAKSLRRVMGSSVYSYLLDNFSVGYEVSLQAKLNSKIKEKRGSKRVPSLFNPSRFIPSRRYGGYLKPLVCTPERGNFYSAASRKSFATHNRREAS